MGIELPNPSLAGDDSAHYDPDIERSVSTKIVVVTCRDRFAPPEQSVAWRLDVLKPVIGNERINVEEGREADLCCGRKFVRMMSANRTFNLSQLHSNGDTSLSGQDRLAGTGI